MKRLADCIAPRHKRASRAVGFALTANDAEAWERASMIWQCVLTPSERACHAFAALAACEPEDATQIAAHLVPEAGPPLTPFANLMGEALLWADVASVAERKAYCLASFLALGHQDRDAFLSKVTERQAA